MEKPGQRRGPSQGQDQEAVRRPGLGHLEPWPELRLATVFVKGLLYDGRPVTCPRPQRYSRFCSTMVLLPTAAAVLEVL